MLSFGIAKVAASSPSKIYLIAWASLVRGAHLLKAKGCT